MRGLTKLFWLLPCVLAVAIWAGAGRVLAADKNKCGCYKNTSGVCFCDKKAKCGCPGDCEPKGCEPAREKLLQKEIEAETKKAAEADRRRPSAGSDKSSASDKGSPSDKRSASGKGSGKGSSGEDGSKREAGKSGKSGSGVESAPPTKKLTSAEVKQLVRLLDAYFVENPDGRSRNVEEVRNELSHSR